MTFNSIHSITILYLKYRSKYEERRGINYFDYMEVEKFFIKHNIQYNIHDISDHASCGSGIAKTQKPEADQ
ncbi:unnamed protein product [Rhizophagus irregularis]|uniref:Uncharacterized protein n=1 Tax=Rhizophagus irregularis TaxID=588596 RepID=A0A915Z0P3_9GLOM|nr:unnamed protein product [Rhizophagus irregularis]CAB5356503.1 unnamed protein product [Rhizophagus irregularis]